MCQRVVERRLTIVVKLTLNLGVMFELQVVFANRNGPCAPALVAVSLYHFDS